MPEAGTLRRADLMENLPELAEKSPAPGPRTLSPTCATQTNLSGGTDRKTKEGEREIG